MNYFRVLLTTLSIIGLFTFNWAVAEAGDGKGTFQSKGCGDCHAANGPSNLKTPQDRVKQKGPDLWFAGSKFKDGWLETWLQNPTPLSGVKYSTMLPEKGTASHPTLSNNEAADVTAFLMSLKDTKMAVGVIDDAKKMRRSQQFKAGTLFIKKQVCFGCHLFSARAKAKPKGGFSGPTLVEANKRLKGDWVYSYLKDQKRYVPFGRMPVYVGPTFQAYTDDELKKLAQYIVNLN